MKKLIGIVLCAVLLAALPAMARQADTAADIGMEEAQRIALEHAGVLDPETAFVLKCEKDWENGRTVYEVEFVVDDDEPATVTLSDELDGEDPPRPAPDGAGLLAQAVASGFGLVEKIDFDELVFETDDE